MSGRPSKDPEDTDYVPTVFKDGKQRRVTSKTPGREERATRRARNIEESEEAGSILLDLSKSLTSSVVHEREVL